MSINEKQKEISLFVIAIQSKRDRSLIDALMSQIVSVVIVGAAVDSVFDAMTRHEDIFNFRFD